MLKAYNDASARFRAILSDEGQGKGAEKAKGIVNPTTGISATRLSTEQPPPPPIDFKKLGREQRMRDMEKAAGLKAAASTGSAAAASRPLQQSNPSWGGRSAWSFAAQPEEGSTGDDDRRPAQPEEGSIYAWTASSTRDIYHIWGNAAGSAPRQEPNLSNGNVALSQPVSNGVS